MHAKQAENSEGGMKNIQMTFAFELINIYYIQGDSGGICTTLGDDSMSDSKQKSSCEHGSDF
jgi:hypothetical protein